MIGVEQMMDAGEQDQSGFGKFGCIPCGMSFKEGWNLKRHVTLVHQVWSTPVKCLYKFTFTFTSSRHCF